MSTHAALSWAATVMSSGNVHGFSQLTGLDTIRDAYAAHLRILAKREDAAAKAFGKRCGDAMRTAVSDIGQNGDTK